MLFTNAAAEELTSRDAAEEFNLKKWTGTITTARHVMGAHPGVREKQPVAQ